MQSVDADNPQEPGPLEKLQIIKEQLLNVRRRVEGIQHGDTGHTVFAEDMKKKIDEILSRLE